MYGVGFDFYGFSRLKTVSYPTGIVYEIDKGHSPQWRQDENGLRLNYGKFVGELFMSEPDGSNIEPMAFPIQPEDLTRPETGYASISGYSPQENAFYVYQYKQDDGLNKILYIPANGSEPTILAQFPEQDKDYFYEYHYSGATNPTFNFSPDGKSLLLHVRTQDGHGRAALLNLKTQDITIFDQDWYHITGWSPDSKGVGTFGGTRVYDATTGELAYWLYLWPINLASWNASGSLYWPTEQP